MKTITNIQLTDAEYDRLVVTSMMLGKSKKKAIALAVKKLNDMADRYQRETVGACIAPQGEEDGEDRNDAS